LKIFFLADIIPLRQRSKGQFHYFYFFKDFFQKKGKMEIMKSRILAFLLFLSVSLLTLSGCVVLIAGSVGAVGGYAVTRDTIQGEYDTRYQNAWKAAVQTCSTLGTVTSRDPNRGLIETMIDRAKVRVEITQMTPEATRIKVKARKGIFPRMGTAQDVFVKIVQQLK